MISSSTTAGRRASLSGHARLAATARAEAPLPRRHGEPPQRRLHLVHGMAGEHVQPEFSDFEQKTFSFPPAMGFGPGAGYVDDMGYSRRRGSFERERIMNGTRQFVHRIETHDDAARIEHAMNQASIHGFHRRNVYAPNCVGAAGAVIGAALKTAPLAPMGHYLTGPQLADRVRAVLNSRGIDAPPEPPRASVGPTPDEVIYSGTIYD